LPWLEAELAGGGVDGLQHAALWRAGEQNQWCGGIVAVVPGRFTVCVWSPELNAAGNSLIGMAALEALSQRIGWSVF